MQHGNPQFLNFSLYFFLLSSVWIGWSKSELLTSFCRFTFGFGVWTIWYEKSKRMCIWYQNIKIIFENLEYYILPATKFIVKSSLRFDYSYHSFFIENERSPWARLIKNKLLFFFLFFLTNSAHSGGEEGGEAKPAVMVFDFAQWNHM